MDREKLPVRALIVVGITSLILGLIGIAYNSVTLFADYSSVLQDMRDEVEPGQFYAALYVMSGICVAFYAALLIVGIQLIRQRSSWAFGLLGIIVLEVLYYFAIGVMWRSSQYGLSVGAATGVSSGGLSFQAFVLFPIWGPWIALWARRRINQSTGSTDNTVLQPTA